MNKKITKYRASGIKVTKFNIGDNNYDKTMVYYKSGKPKQEKNYKNGSLEGNLISYWENGKIHTKGKYKNNQRVGIWETYDKRGKLLLTEEYTK